VSFDFDDLFTDNDASAEELSELRHVHELLLSASPPPPPLRRRLRRVPRVPGPARWRTNRRGRLIVALTAAAATTAAFAVGYDLGQGGGGGFEQVFTRTMRGLSPVANASATIAVGKREQGGNWPLRMTVRGLPRLPRRDWYQLYLTRHGKPDVLCGAFQATGGHITHVQLNAPSDLDEYSGWIVTAHIPGHAPRALLTTRALGPAPLRVRPRTGS
jgi:hypothetical protein